MKQKWRALSVKIDGLSRRERLIAFVAALVVTVIVAGMLFVEAPHTRRSALLARMAQQQAEISSFQKKIQDAERMRLNPDAQLLAQKRELNAQILNIDRNLNEVQKNLIPAREMKSLLQEVLARNSRVQLISMRSLPGTPLIGSDAKPEKSAAPSDRPAASDRNVYKHGVEVKLQGGYSDLHDYLARLEKLPWRMLWSRASLNAADYPRLTMTVTIYTLSLDKAWLVV